MSIKFNYNQRKQISLFVIMFTCLYDQDVKSRRLVYIKVVALIVVFICGRKLIRVRSNELLVDDNLSEHLI